MGKIVWKKNSLGKNSLSKNGIWKYKKLYIIINSVEQNLKIIYWIEKLLNKYKQIIIDDLNKKVGILENNQRGNINATKGVIYVLKTDMSLYDLYKIGKTLKFKNRLKTHNSSHSDNVHLYLAFETDFIDEVENCLKAVLKSKIYRKRKEFYQIDPESLKKVLETCETATLIARGGKIPKNFDEYYVFWTKINKHKIWKICR